MKPAKLLVTCPKCGHQQQEPSAAYSSVCKECHQHFRVQDVARPAPAPANAPVELPREGRRVVSCFRCQTELEVPSAAQSTMCKRCSAHVDLRDYHITGSASKSFKTKGRLVIEEGATLLNTEIVAGDIVLKGKVIGKIEAEGVLELHPTAQIKGTWKTAKLVLPEGAKLQPVGVLQLTSADIAGELVGDVQAKGTFRLMPSARFFGDLEAANIVVEPGAVMVGCAKVGTFLPSPAEPTLVAV